MALTYITTNELNQFLPTGKLTLTDAQASNEDELEATESATVFGSLSSEFPVTEWIADPTTIPLLVRSLIAMRMAGRIYLRTTSDTDAEENNYGRMLLTDAELLMGGLLAGTIAIDYAAASANIAGTSDTYTYVDPLFTVGQRF